MFFCSNGSRSAKPHLLPDLGYEICDSDVYTRFRVAMFAMMVRYSAGRRAGTVICRYLPRYLLSRYLSKCPM
jgi:hypothetical protein